MNNDVFAIYADIGGTHARFALQSSQNGSFDSVKVYKSEQYREPCTALFEYLDTMQITTAKYVVIGIAGPINGDFLELTNVDWAFSINASKMRISAKLGTSCIYFINDFEALAYALPYLKAHEKIQVGRGDISPYGPMSLIGPGTGVGVSHLIHTNNAYSALGCEGGHTLYAPQDFEEVEIVKLIMQTSPIVTLEHVLSGGYGITNLIHAMSVIHGVSKADWSPKDLFDSAFVAKDLFALSILARYCAMLGNAAGNVALMIGATGGIYIGGGIVPRLGDYFFQSSFRKCFEAKGAASDYVKMMPTFLVMADFPGLLGVQHALSSISGIHK